jgi:Fe2+ transport system protein B
LNFRHLFKAYSGKHLKDSSEPKVLSTAKQRLESAKNSSVKVDQPENTDLAEEMSRTEYLKHEQVQSETQKRKKLARKLNWVIFYLTLAIFVVYCFMFFVNF